MKTLLQLLQLALQCPHLLSCAPRLADDVPAARTRDEDDAGVSEERETVEARYEASEHTAQGCTQRGAQRAALPTHGSTQSSVSKRKEASHDSGFRGVRSR